MDTIRIIGQSPQILNLIEVARKIGKNSNLTTLISGENGTGKELVARIVHQSSNNADKPFVDINCGAIPETLLESELFGHEKGSFTGAANEKKGLFELADGGTIFLDELATTSINFQSKLLKVVENKRFRRVGGLKEISISTRIIAAVNIDLQEAVKNGAFREDLYYRLNIGQINVPPLRERGDDIVLLAKYFLEICNREYSYEIKGFRSDALELIKKYPWPGNVRQLKNTIERAVLIESEDWIEVNDLNLDFDLENIRKTLTQKMNKFTPPNMDIGQFSFPTKGIALEELEKGIITTAIGKADGNLSHAARLLKISRGKLRYKMNKFGFENTDNLN